VLRIRPRDEPVIAADEEEPFRAFVQGAFGLRRKQMRRVLRELWKIEAGEAERALEMAGVEPAGRPETISPAQFARLLRVRLR